MEGSPVSRLEEAGDDAQLEELEKELEDLEADVVFLQQRLAKLQSQNGCASLIDIPLENLCWQLPAADFMALSMAGMRLYKTSQELLPSLLPEAPLSPLISAPCLWRAWREPCLTLGLTAAVPQMALGRALKAFRRSPTGPLCIESEDGECFGTRNLQPYEAVWALTKHHTPRLLRFKVKERTDKGAVHPETSVMLLDSAIPKQPLFTVSWRREGARYQMHVFTREVVSGRCAWAYRQRRFNLEAFEAADLHVHVEFDWPTARCWMQLGRDQLQEFPFSGSSGSPTTDQLRLQLSPAREDLEISLLLG
ncbi:unnamed protein product [Cladocopium goreaui]|uniref:Uncharacterized protein n=1 Tax=Cladocopium goreaui TaxID=2562237 RepID=A0A9P1FNU1_9DINO|nr:unnamed protein product [Cladocopium goreaui]